MSSTRIEYLVELYFSNNITEIQKEELAGVVSGLSDEQVKALLEKAWINQSPHTYMPDDISDRIVTSLFTEPVNNDCGKTRPALYTPQRRLVWWKAALAAACALALISSAVLFVKQGPQQPRISNHTVPLKQIPADVRPGGQKALLVLADGSRIVLDSASSGLLAQQGSVQVEKLSNGKISYTTNGEAAKELLFNTMSTPMGGMYQLILPDGSNVWLNSASSIRYPTAFGGGERQVSITGEVYFEVQKNPGHPFVVTVNDNTSIKVLGTHFNVNAYPDEAAIKTTLMEGAVAISRGNNSTSIKPGEQAQVDKSGSIKTLKDIDLEETIAWKNGNFLFNSTELPAVLRQAARWYSLEVVYEGRIPDDKFSGQISRSVNLSNLLKWMQWSDVHFKLEGKKLIIKD